jgi:hypothetical protein
MNTTSRTLVISFAIITLGGFLLNSAYASYEHGDLYEYDTNECKGGLKVFATLEKQGPYDYDAQLKVSFAYDGYVKSKVVPIQQNEVGYLFYEGTVPEYGKFKVTVRNLSTGEYEVVTAINHAGCHPEYVSLRVPQ